MTALYTFTTKTAAQMRDDMLRSMSNGFKALAAAQGNPNFQPNVGQSSDYYLTATAIANELAVVHANSTISNDQNKPTTATGSDLDDWLNLMSVPRQNAAPAFGFVTCTCAVSSTLITAGTQLSYPPNSTLYEVQTTSSYGTSTPIPVIAVGGGSATNLPHGAVLQWVETPAYMSSTASVGATLDGEDGLTGGADSEVGVDGPPRARLLSKFQNPPTPGNSAQVIGWCSGSSPLVQSASVYPALLGPSTVFFAVWRQPQTSGVLSSTSKDRSLPAALVSSTVVPTVAGFYEGGVFLLGVSTTDQPCDIALQMDLPPAASANPPGPGGGWLDGVPWPTSNGGTAAVAVTSVASGGAQITVNATTGVPPTPGVTHVAFLDPTTWTLNTATVLAYSGTSGAWVLTLDTAWPNVATGNYVFPQATNQATYVASILSAFGNLGAGEWSPSAPASSVSFRRPLVNVAWPYSLDGRFLKVVENSGDEVDSVTWLYRQATSPTVPAQPVATVLTNNYVGTLTAISLTGTVGVTNGSATFSTTEPQTTITLSGTLGVTNGSATVSTSTSQLAKVAPGYQVLFASQPGVVYSVASLTSSTITLTYAYSGTTNASTTANSSSTLAAGSQVQFASQPGVTYSVASRTSSSITLTDAYSGVTAGTTTATATSGAPNVLVPRNIAVYPS